MLSRNLFAPNTNTIAKGIIARNVFSNSCSMIKHLNLCFQNNYFSQLFFHANLKVKFKVKFKSKIPEHKVVSISLLKMHFLALIQRWAGDGNSFSVLFIDDELSVMLGN